MKIFTGIAAAVWLAIVIITGMVPKAEAQVAPEVINGTYNTAPGWTTALADTIILFGDTVSDTTQ